MFLANMFRRNTTGTPSDALQHRLGPPDDGNLVWPAWQQLTLLPARQRTLTGRDRAELQRRADPWQAAELDELRCPLLRPDPAQKDRLTAIRENLVERIAEARQEGWLGELEGLEATLAAADTKLLAMDVLSPKRLVLLGVPTVPSTAQAER